MLTSIFYHKMMIAVVTLFLISTTTLAQSADDILGKWTNPNNSTTVEVYKKGETYSAKIIEAKVEKQIGKILVWGLKYSSKNNEWAEGKIQKPDMKHSVDCFIELESYNTLSISGYHGLRIFSSTEKWKRK